MFSLLGLSGLDQRSHSTLYPVATGIDCHSKTSKNDTVDAKTKSYQAKFDVAARVTARVTRCLPEPTCVDRSYIGP